MADAGAEKVPAYRTWNANIGKAVVLAVYSVGHLIINMCGLAVVLMFTRMESADRAATALLLYSFCAFALTAPIGAIADRLTHTGKLAVWGCIVTAVAMLAVPVPFLLAVLLGIGNALFRAGGGTSILHADNGCARFGIFVSTGVIGYFLGLFAAENRVVGSAVSMGATVVLMVILIVLVLLTEPMSYTFETVAPFPKGMTVSYPMKKFFAVVCLFAVSALRSFGLMSFDFAWKSDVGRSSSALLIAIAAALGVMLGGIASELLGMKPTASLTLAASALLMIFSSNIVPAVFAVMLFNMTVSVTVRAISNVCGGHEGISLGLYSLALFCGYVPFAYGVTMPFGIYGNTAVSIIALALTAIGLELAGGGRRTTARVRSRK